MAEDTKFVRALVDINGLKNNMKIQAYVGFSKKHQNMAEDTCKFIKHNFANCKTRIIRQNQKLEIDIDQLQVGDTLQRIFKIPSGLKKLTIVNEKLVKALGARGFLKFEVVQPEASTAPREMKETPKKSISKKEENLIKAKQRANEYIQKVKENVETHDKTSKAVENIMDDARKGKVDVAAVKSYVDVITTQASAEAMSAIVSLKESNQTYDHCVDVGVIFQSSYYQIKEKSGASGNFKNKNQALLGAFLHDFGKSKIPKDILDSTVRFERDSQEMSLMQSHPTFAVELLANMGMSDIIINMAHYHHVKQDTTINSCYPKDVSYNQVIYETRLISIIDVYQALVGKRKYKKSWNPPAAMRYLDALAGVEFDVDVWDDFLAVMGLYPKGSLVQLNDNSLAFVIDISGEDPEKPKVVVVRNAAGEDLKHNNLIDLTEEKDIVIAKDLDCLEVFGDDAIEIFSNIDIS